MTVSQHPTTPPANVSDILPSPRPSGGKINEENTENTENSIQGPDLLLERKQDITESEITGTDSFQNEESKSPQNESNDKISNQSSDHSSSINPNINELSQLEGSSSHHAETSPKSEEARLRSLVAHYELQNKLLTIESYENAQRYEVETSIMQREIDRLLMERKPAVEDDDDSEMLSSMYRRRLRKAKLKLRDAAELIQEKDDEINRLKSRLRQGWQHREAMERAPRDDPQTPKTGLTALGILASQALSHGSERSRRSSGSTVTEDDVTDEEEEPSITQDEAQDDHEENEIEASESEEENNEERDESVEMAETTMHIKEDGDVENDLKNDEIQAMGVSDMKKDISE